MTDDRSIPSPVYASPGYAGANDPSGSNVIGLDVRAISLELLNQIPREWIETHPPNAGFHVNSKQVTDAAADGASLVTRLCGEQCARVFADKPP
jgi:hypothetical protein